MKHTQSQRGAVSLFVVIFAALLITIVTISFVQLMLRNQQEATTADISQSAYDSALAGVEDAKRALAEGKPLSPTDCNTVKVALGGDNSDAETKIQQSENDLSLDQAYTCVKVDTTPGNLQKSLEYQKIQESSTLLPLKTVNGAAFDTIEISWKLPVETTNPTLFSGATQTLLPRTGEWGEFTPALLRAQLIQYDDSFDLSSFDAAANGTASDNARTKFLYPVAWRTTAPIESTFLNDTSPTGIACKKDDTYMCTVKLKLEQKDGSPQNFKKNVFLRLSALYNNADVQVKVYAAGQPQDFAGVQAVVDSTGRAGDAFRRVRAVVDLSVNDNFPYPQAALDLDGNLCKTFKITNDPAQYDSGSCDPSADPKTSESD